MAIKLVTSWYVLFKLANELGQARLSGDQDRIEAANQAHESYRKMCLKADEMIHFPDIRGR